jgi:hypothetical protein
LLLGNIKRRRVIAVISPSLADHCYGAMPFGDAPMRNDGAPAAPHQHSWQQTYKAAGISTGAL